MKKIYLVMLLPFLSLAQENGEKKFTGEIKSNLFDLVVGKTFNLGYEHFLNRNQGLQFDVSLFDTYSYLDAGYMEKTI
jgi:hypothetical protein